MNVLGDVITYIRRLVKSPSNAQLSDNLIIDYINRFWILDVDARIQLFDLKTKYGFTCVPGITSYNMPLYGVNQFPLQMEGSAPTTTISAYPVYQGFMDPAYINGIQVPFYNQRDAFYKVWTPYVQTLQPAAIGDGTSTTISMSLPFFPAIVGHVDISGIIASGSTIDPIVGPQLGYTGTTFPGTILPGGNPPLTSLYPGVTITAQDSKNATMVLTDSGQLSSANQQIGFLQTTSGSTIIAAGTVNYATGEVTAIFPSPPAADNEIQTNCYFYEPGIPRAILFYDNVITIQPPPNISYYIEMDAYLSPAAFLATGTALQFAYMSEYIARGAARKILSDTGDIEQFTFYEPLFKEQETLVWKRSQRQFTATRTGTIFSDLQSQNTTNANGVGSV